MVKRMSAREGVATIMKDDLSGGVKDVDRNKNTQGEMNNSTDQDEKRADRREKVSVNC